jgi:hypothetical protein
VCEIGTRKSALASECALFADDDADQTFSSPINLLALSLSSVHCVQLLSTIRRDIHLLRGLLIVIGVA